MTYEIFNEDCLKKMDEMISEGRKFQLVIADLPYGQSNCEWDKQIPFEEIWPRLDALTDADTPILLFGTEPFSSELRLSNKPMYKYDLYWVKEKPVNFFQLKRRFGKTTENICVFYKYQPTYNPQKFLHQGKPVKNSPKGRHNSITAGIGPDVTAYEDDGTRYPTDILNFNREPMGTTDHPTQKPVLLLEYLIKTFSNPGDNVLDFVMGVGSTGVACQNTDRNFTGIEIDEKYYNISIGRLQSNEAEINTLKNEARNN